MYVENKKMETIAYFLGVMKNQNNKVNDKFFDKTKLKAVAVDKLLENLKTVFDKVKTLWEKEKMLVTSFSSMFP